MNTAEIPPRSSVQSSVITKGFRERTEQVLVSRQGVAVRQWGCSRSAVKFLSDSCSPPLCMDNTTERTLADLSRNASVISSSSDSETSTTTALRTPRPRPTRTFSSPRSRSPHSPNSQSVRPPPVYLTRELGVSDGAENRDLVPEPTRQPQPRSKSRKRSRSQNPSANTRLSAQDFVFGETLGEGSYSTVRPTYLHDAGR